MQETALKQIHLDILKLQQHCSTLEKDLEILNRNTKLCIDNLKQEFSLI